MTHHVFGVLGPQQVGRCGVTDDSGVCLMWLVPWNLDLESICSVSSGMVGEAGRLWWLQDTEVMEDSRKKLLLG